MFKPGHSAQTCFHPGGGGKKPAAKKKAAPKKRRAPPPRAAAPVVDAMNAGFKKAGMDW